MRLAFPLVALAGPLLLGAASGCTGPTRAVARTPETTRAEPDAGWYFEHGREAAEQGDAARAEQYLAIAIDRGYDARRGLPLLLAVCVRSSHLRAALNHAEPYLKRHPDDAELRYLVASIYLGIGDSTLAQRELERLLRSDPRHARAHYLLAVLELDRGGDGAGVHLERYLELAPHGEHAAEARGRLQELTP